MIECYELFYMNVLIGHLTIECEANKFLYEPIREAVKKVNDEIFVFLTNRIEGNINSMPFFENRIKNMKKFNLLELRYQTDNYLIKKCN